MASHWRPTLRQVFGCSLLGLLLGLGLLFYLTFHGTEQSILHSSERYRELASSEVAQRVTAYLDEAPMAVAHFEEEVRFGLIDPMKVDSVGQGLLSLLLANTNISEATLTYADSRSFGPGATRPADPAFSGQVAVLRSATAGEFLRKRTWFDGKQFVSESDTISQDAPAKMGTIPQPTPPPTQHSTFQTAVSKDFFGQLISTDLHWSQVDAALPESRRRVEVSVQKTIEDAHGKFAGVLRIGLMKTQIDAAVRQHITAPGENDPHQIFLCDDEGRLITGFGDRDRVTVSGDDLRIDAANVPPVVARALKDPVLKDLGDRPTGACSFTFEDRVYLCTYTNLPQTQGWIVGVVVPRDFYLGRLVAIRDRILYASLALIAAVILGSWLISRSVVRAQSLILRETARMNRFEFTPSENRSYLRDVGEVLGGLERAKTAMRAMSKYVPVKLVRQLYHEGQEPMLGGCTSELSVLFTDIKDFTAIAERTPPAQLAKILGRYLEAIAGAIQEESGTIDKFIGDAVMAFWNAPEKVPGHEVLACRAALRCREAVRKICGAPECGEMPQFETRFGLHRCQASVGHFGAPDRFNYTAIGDGINLTSRLEGLNKFYGTTIIASESIHAAARDAFEFRLLDRVAVKGKSQGVMIYELLAEKVPATPRPAFVENYEQAFALYQSSDFAAAIPLLEKHPDDEPSRVLLERCHEYLAHPPADWDGIHIFGVK